MKIVIICCHILLASFAQAYFGNEPQIADVIRATDYIVIATAPRTTGMNPCSEFLFKEEIYCDPRLAERATAIREKVMFKVLAAPTDRFPVRAGADYLLFCTLLPAPTDGVPLIKAVLASDPSALPDPYEFISEQAKSRLGIKWDQNSYVSGAAREQKQLWDELGVTSTADYIRLSGKLVAWRILGTPSQGPTHEELKNWNSPKVDAMMDRIRNSHPFFATPEDFWSKRNSGQKPNTK